MQPQLPNSENPGERTLSLRQQTCDHELALLKAAAESTNPTIQKYALKSAEAERKQRYRQEARISPRGAWFFCLVIWLAGVACSWYSLLYYAWPLAIHIIWVVLVGCLTATFICLTLSKTVEASDLVSFLRTIYVDMTLWVRSLRNSEK
jgi:hypothetical protein